MAKVKHVNYFTKEKLALIDQENWKLYQRYLQSKKLKNPDSKSWITYENFFKQFLVFLGENYGDLNLYSEKFMKNAVDIMEEFMGFCQMTLENHKKVINTKVSAVSSFYMWSVKKGYIENHPFANKLERMQNIKEEKIINSYFLTPEQVEQIRKTLELSDDFTIQDQILFEVAYDSANRLGALEQLRLSNLDMNNMLFKDVREKRGKNVEVVFGDHTKELIEQWLEMRKDEEKYDGLKVDSLLLVKDHGAWKPMLRQPIYQRFIRYGKIVGIEDFRPHCVRKSRLNNIYNETGDLALAAELANHESTETTRQSYIKPKSKAEVRDKINQLTHSRSVGYGEQHEDN